MNRRRSSGMRLLSLLGLACAHTAAARAILGVDLGSLYMKVALVQSGSPLEIVTNLHSKRKTEQMILFDQNQRFYGADAAALLARKSHQTPEAMSVLLGRDEEHPVVQVLAERHYPIGATYNETRLGVTLNVDGQLFTPEELVAMVLNHAVDISVAYAAEQGGAMATPPRDVVLTVPAMATQKERRALLDAAALADLKVLTLIDETTAAALHYAMDKTFADGEQLLLFYNMGASSLQVSLIRFFAYEQPQRFGKPKASPALEVLSKAWDMTLGGNAFDHLLVELLADQFNAAWEKAGRRNHRDVRTFPRAMTKLRIQANKVKHVLSANNDIPVFMEAVHDDVSLSTHVTRQQLEDLASGLLERAIAPAQRALELANKTAADVTGMELIGGGMRIPRIQAELSKAFGGLEVGLHINADESMALGAAFAGANISTAFRVRHVGMTDINPFQMQVSLTNLNEVNKGDEEWQKNTVLFKSSSKLGAKKTIAFTHDCDIHCSLDYDGADPNLPKGTELSIEKYNITGIHEFAKEMEEKKLGKPKVSLQFELSSSGITQLIRAEATVEDTYTVEEEVEVDDDGATDTTADFSAANKSSDTNASGENATDTNSTSKKATVKPKKKIKVMKALFGIRSPEPAFVSQEKKKLHKRSLEVKTYYEGRVQPHSAEGLAASKQKLLEMARRDKERMMLEESRNNVEAYIYKIKNKLEDDAELIEKVTTINQRDAVKKLADDAQEWMDDEGYNADYATMEDKFVELSTPFEKILLRVKESVERPAAIAALKKKLEEIEQLMAKWEEKMPHINATEKEPVFAAMSDVRKWMSDKETAQAKLKPHEDPAFLSDEVPSQTKAIEALVLKLSRKPKPKPVKNETTAENATASGTGNGGTVNSSSAEAVDAPKTDGAASKSPTTDSSGSTESTGAPQEKEDEL